MSYDVSIGDRWFNYTYNVAKLFHDHIGSGDKTGIQALDGLTGKQACAVLQDGFARISATYLQDWETNAVGAPKFCAKYDAPNGWGSTVGALIFLSQIMAACAEHPRKKVDVS